MQAIGYLLQYKLQFQHILRMNKTKLGVGWLLREAADFGRKINYQWVLKDLVFNNKLLM